MKNKTDTKNIVIGTYEVEKAAQTLREYKAGKASLEARVTQNEKWWHLRHAGAVSTDTAPVSAWLFNVLANKHADAIDSYPEASILPREKGDTQEALRLSKILPAILENNDFEELYSDNWWCKLKHGCCVYGVFWNSEKENGLGDIQISSIDLLNIFWEPGIKDIQKSRNLFIVDLRDEDALLHEYPFLKGKSLSGAIDVTQYTYDEAIDTSGKVLVVDWYYKVRAKNGKTLLHYCKFAGDNVLFASENDERFKDRGWYDHGEYPVVTDTLFPQEGTPAGFGYIAITKDPQIYIDKLNGALLENALMAAKPRYFAKVSAGINEEEFLDWSKPIVHVEGDVNEERLRPINVMQMPGGALNLLNMKVNELKETSASNDFTRGAASNGITAASAIAALQEAGNKTSRDMLRSSYRAYTKINYLCIELIRQFYGETRSFRITGDDGGYRFEEYSNERLAAIEGRLKPVFDIAVKAQKKSPYSRLSQNEMAKELFKIGFFNPENRQQALNTLEIMDFEGKSQIEARLMGNGGDAYDNG